VSCGYDYGCRVRLGRESFPTRTYGDLTLKEGVYDAVIVELGSGEGKNWWCVAYPPLCFIAAEETGKEEVEYRSWIADLFRK
ncbi:MAG: stage II sporulation protein R, partial [Clostridia bacterium]|nr:stage II sporulation protein R [Clostridia bacterium]